MYAEYVTKKFRATSMNIIDRANEIIEEYQDDGFNLTLRQLYYQFVSRDLIPNTQKEYNRIGKTISDGRLAGLIDWNAIEDRTRNVVSLQHWDNPGQIIRAATRGFKLDHWQGQPFRPEVWIEKEALIGVIESVCNELDVSFFACKGYVSQSEMWSASQRFIGNMEDDNQLPVIIHLGDHDPSGIDMTRDIEDRQNLFGVSDFKIDRIALNMDQVDKYNPPPNPAKLTDSRCTGYIKQFGENSWELDALEPRTLAGLIREQVLVYRLSEPYQAVIEKEKEYLAILKKVEENWEHI